MYYHRYFKAVVVDDSNHTASSQNNKNDPEALVKTIEAIQRSGIHVYGIEIGVHAKPITPHGANANWAAVMGNEDLGLSCRISSACHEIVYIPQAHGDSLNVGHAAAIAMFELGREGPKALYHDGLAACT
jgi:tRNA G18 (ribose-2'-O)-methylase SpoU